MSNQHEVTVYDRVAATARVSVGPREMSNDFLHGFAAALTTLAKSFREGKLVEQVMNCNGVTLKDLVRSGADSFDTRAILEVISGDSPGEKEARGCTVAHARRLIAKEEPTHA